MIAIIDYGMGNLGSVAKAFRKLGYEAVITPDRNRIREARSIVVPGVGAFGQCMSNLGKTGMDEAIHSAIEEGKPYLGICLGYQVLFEGSEEDAGTPGLGIIDGVVKKFSSTLKVPHMGWNTVRIKQRTPLFADIPDESYFYFVHSFYPEPVSGDIIAATTEYGVPFAAAIRKDNIFATQFHPEKSQSIGLEMLKNFAALGEKKC
ncbi:MAG: imidazole glycerol phosphate synthase subunit HisH [Candidatus Tritonobacter lacicola]|nr:imidazole glycerol phosphate synthase subunit HisH [Candidatus Tritonobacter lacicola]